MSGRRKASTQLPMGAIIDGKLNEIHDVDLRNPDEIQEFVDHSWYKLPERRSKGLHPWDGITDHAYELCLKAPTATKTKFELALRTTASTRG